MESRANGEKHTTHTHTHITSNKPNAFSDGRLTKYVLYAEQNSTYTTQQAHHLDYNAASEGANRIE